MCSRAVQLAICGAGTSPSGINTVLKYKLCYILSKYSLQTVQLVVPVIAKKFTNSCTIRD